MVADSNPPHPYCTVHDQPLDWCENGEWGNLGRRAEAIDAHLDANVAQVYKDQPLAQDWARCCKGMEEKGEAIAELILATGQNPRKPLDPDAAVRLLSELADSALSGIYAIQHFTKDRDATMKIVADRARYHCRRAGLE